MLNDGSAYLPNAGEGEVPLWNGTYAATVYNNADPLGVGRLQLQIPQVLGNAVSAWSVPLGNYYNVPILGETVSACFIGGDPAQPAWIGPLDLAPVVIAGTTRVFYSSSAPPTPAVGDVWYQSVGGVQAAPQVWTFDPVHSTFSWVTQVSLGGIGIGTGTIDGVNVAATFHGLNMIPDPQFGNTAINAVRLADANTSGTWTLSGGAAHNTASNVIAHLPVMPSASKAMWLNPGETYYLSFTATTSASTQVGLTIVCSNGTNLSVQSTGTFAGQTFTGVVTIPAGVTSGFVRFFTFAASGAPTVTLSNPVCQPASLFSPTIIGGTITGGTFIGTGTGNELMLYGGTPGVGNLNTTVNSDAAWTTDGHTNVVPGGFGTYGVVGIPGGGGTEYWLAHLSTFYPGGLAANRMRLGFQMNTTGQNAFTNTGDTGYIEVTDGGQMNFFALSGINIPGSTTAVVNISTDTWHNMTLLNSWTNNVSFTAARYRLMPDNSVRVMGVITSNAATSGTFFTLPVGYRPTTTGGAPVGANTSGAAAGVIPNLRWDTSGNLSINNVTIPGASSSFFFMQDIPLD